MRKSGTGVQVRHVAQAAGMLGTFSEFVVFAFFHGLVTGVFLLHNKAVGVLWLQQKKKGGFWDVKMRYPACFWMYASLSHTHGKVGPMGKGQSSLELLFEAREPFVTRRVVICGGGVLERPGATGQHSRETRVFSLSVTCICFGIIKR